MAAFTHCIACGWFLLACKGLENGSHSCQADSWAEVGNRGLGMLKAVCLDYRIYSKEGRGAYMIMAFFRGWYIFQTT